MAVLPTPEEIAGEILSIFVGHFNCRPGEVLRANNFLAVWHGRSLKAEDFKPGMELAAQRGWIEVLSGGDFISSHCGWLCRRRTEPKRAFKTSAPATVRNTQ